MRFAVSNIAWPREQDAAVAGVLSEFGIEGIEIAPTKIWANPLTATDAEIADYRQFWNERGIAIVAAQALLFGKPELTVFESAETRQRTRGCEPSSPLRRRSPSPRKVVCEGIPSSLARNRPGTRPRTVVEGSHQSKAGSCWIVCFPPTDLVAFQNQAKWNDFQTLPSPTDRGIASCGSGFRA